ncbi:hypothetical protein GCM10010483_47390 [Actinokineospora diospyrosa]
MAVTVNAYQPWWHVLPSTALSAAAAGAVTQSSAAHAARVIAVLLPVVTFVLPDVVSPSLSREPEDANLLTG